MKNTIVAICIIAALVACTVDARMENDVNTTEAERLANEAGCSQERINDLMVRINTLKSTIKTTGLYRVGKVTCSTSAKTITDCDCENLHVSTMLPAPLSSTLKSPVSAATIADQTYTIIIEGDKKGKKVNCGYYLTTKNLRPIQLKCPSKPSDSDDEKPDEEKPDEEKPVAKRSALSRFFKRGRKNLKRRVGRFFKRGKRSRNARRKLLQQGGCSS